MSSQRIGKCSTMANGSASAAMTIKSLIPRFSVFVAVMRKNFSNKKNNFNNKKRKRRITFVGALLELLVVIGV